MKGVTLLMGSMAGLVFSALILLAQSAPTSSVLSQDGAFAILKGLDDHTDLIPSSLFPKIPQGVLAQRYDHLKPENCFGLEPEKGWKVVGESDPRWWYNKNESYTPYFRNYLDIVSAFFASRHSNRPNEPTDGPSAPYDKTFHIGFLYSNRDFLVGNKSLQAGSCAVLATPETLELLCDKTESRDGSTTFYANWPQIKLAKSLDPSLFDIALKEHPRFSLVQEGRRTFLVFGENRLLVRKQTGGPGRASPRRPSSPGAKPRN